MSQPHQFDAPLLLRQNHFMTLFPHYWPRGQLLFGIPVEPRLFTTGPDTQLLGYCHWQPDRRSAATVVMVHGLEGCSESHYMHGISSKAYRAGLNVIRMNQRTCGGTEHLTPTLYNSGLSEDYRVIVRELASIDQLDRIWLVGYSMGGNLVLKAAGELGRSEPSLAGAIAVCPNIDPTKCVNALEQPRNWIYHRHFLRSLKARLRRKAKLFPGRWDLAGLDDIRIIHEFDDRYTAIDGGYASAADYYDRAGSRHVLGDIAIRTHIVTSQDDPFIPYEMFSDRAIRKNPHIKLIAPRHGGHCGFFQQGSSDEDRYWVENRVIDFIRGEL
jgi:uncharacterized protein